MRIQTPRGTRQTNVTSMQSLLSSASISSCISSWCRYVILPSTSCCTSSSAKVETSSNRSSAKSTMTSMLLEAIITVLAATKWIIHSAEQRTVHLSAYRMINSTCHLSVRLNSQRLCGRICRVTASYMRKGLDSIPGADVYFCPRSILLVWKLGRQKWGWPVGSGCVDNCWRLL